MKVAKVGPSQVWFQEETLTLKNVGHLINTSNMVKCHFDQTVFPPISAGALIRRKVLNLVGRLLRVPLNQLENGLVVPGKFTAFTKNSAIGQKLKKYKITHLGTLQAHGYRNNWK